MKLHYIPDILKTYQIDHGGNMLGYSFPILVWEILEKLKTAHSCYELSLVLDANCLAILSLVKQLELKGVVSEVPSKLYNYSEFKEIKESNTQKKVSKNSVANISTVVESNLLQREEKEMSSSDDVLNRSGVVDNSSKEKGHTDVDLIYLEADEDLEIVSIDFG